MKKEFNKVENQHKDDPFADSMVRIEGGSFYMGSNDYSWEHEQPIHEVKLSSFYLSKYQVTQKQWREVMGNNPSYFKGDNLPVEQVSWNDIQVFLQKLNAKTSKNYRLPTEAEWEYAAKGGNLSCGYKYVGSNNLDEVAWHYDNSSDKTHSVGQKKPNELGLYDMSGNVWEWCYDFKNSPSNNPKVPSGGLNRVLRGGSWYDDAYSCRSACRLSSTPNSRISNIGFRIAL